MSRKSPKDSKLYKYIGSRIKTKRESLKITQTVLGDCTGVTFQQIQKYEKASNKVPIDRLLDISKRLEEPFSYFVPNDSDLAEYSTDSDVYRREPVGI